MNMNNHKNTFVMRRNAYEKEREGNKLWGYNEAKNECLNMNHGGRRTESLKGYGSMTLNALASAEMKERLEFEMLGEQISGQIFLDEV